MNKFFKMLSATILGLSTLFFAGCIYISYNFPDDYHITEGETTTFSCGIFSINIRQEAIECLCTDSDFPIYPANLNFLEIFPIKPVLISVMPKRKVVPCGTPFGVRIHTDGVMIINIADVKTAQGIACPGKNSGIQKGDIITKINEQPVSTNEEIGTLVEESQGQGLKLSVIRENASFETILNPVKSIEDNCYRAGIWVRDSSAGIGTLTFVDPDSKCFSGLGHGICDIDTGDILRLSHGDIVEAAITDTKKGSKGSPGELKGCFTDPRPIGKLLANTQTGVYGVLEKMPENQESIPVAMKQQVQKGPAKIFTTIEGSKPAYYNINIDSINYNVNNPIKNILISTQEQDLLEKTGGIVQGMSGSPIIQNGMLVGAVTHVFVNNPTKGYAIFAETMLTNSNNIFESRYKKVS